MVAVQSRASSPQSQVLLPKYADATSVCRYVRPRLALVGDAAHTVHPLAGQGVNLGFGDVKALIDAIAYATETGIDIGNIALLQVSQNVSLLLVCTNCQQYCCSDA